MYSLDIEPSQHLVTADTGSTVDPLDDLYDLDFICPSVKASSRTPLQKNVIIRQLTLFARVASSG